MISAGPRFVAVALVLVSGLTAAAQDKKTATIFASRFATRASASHPR